MTRFADQIRDEFGRAVDGATIYVYVWDSVIEAAGDLETTLTNDIAVPLANPLTSDEFGGFYFNSADGKKLIEVHFGGELRFKELINIGAVAEGEAVLAATRTALAAIIPGAGKARYLTEAGREGTFVFSTANLSALVAADTAQGVYVPPTGLTGSTGAWVRKFSGPLQFKWFGAIADDNGTAGTDNGPAYLAAQGLLQALALIGFVNPTFYRGAPSLDLGPGAFYFGTTIIEPLASCRIFGAGGIGWGAPTRIRYAVNTTGLRAQAHNTSGAGTVDGPHFSGADITVEDIYFIGGYNSVTPNEGEYHGCHAKRPIHLTRCTFDGFQGDGLYSHATAGGGAPDEGNSNLGRVTDCAFLNNRNGRFMQGADANAWYFSGNRYDYNRQAGVNERSFLGSAEAGAHLAGNGFQYHSSLPTSIVSYGGNRYYPIRGQAVGASTNAPKSSTVTITIAIPGVVSWAAHGLVAGTPVAFSTTGALPTGLAANTTYYVLAPNTNDFTVAATVGGAAITTTGSQSGVHTAGAGVDNTWWGYAYVGAPLAGSVPAWVNGISVREGGAIISDHTNNNNASSFTGVYTENGQPPIQLTYPVSVFGGLHGALLKGTGAWLTNYLGALSTSGNFLVQGNFGSAGASNSFGPQLAAPADNDFFLDNTNSSNTIWFRSWSAGVPQNDGYVLSSRGNGLYLNGTVSLNLRVGGNLIAALTATAVDLASGKVFKIDGTQLVGARKTGWAVDTGTAKRTANATYTGTASVGYVQAELQAAMDALRDATQTIKALKDDLHGTAGHGLIGT